MISAGNVNIFLFNQLHCGRTAHIRTKRKKYCNIHLSIYLSICINVLPHSLHFWKLKAKLRRFTMSPPHLFAGLVDIQLNLSTPLKLQGPIYMHKVLLAGLKTRKNPWNSEFPSRIRYLAAPGNNRHSVQQGVK